MVGYSTCGYRLWDKKNRRMVIARDVIFNNVCGTEKEENNEGKTSKAKIRTEQNTEKDNILNMQETEDTPDTQKIEEDETSIESEEHIQHETRETIRSTRIYREIFQTDTQIIMYI